MELAVRKALGAETYQQEYHIITARSPKEIELAFAAAMDRCDLAEPLPVAAVVIGGHFMKLSQEEVVSQTVQYARESRLFNHAGGLVTYASIAHTPDSDVPFVRIEKEQIDRLPDILEEMCAEHASSYRLPD